VTLRRALRDLLAPAPDPRHVYRDAGEVRPELLARVREALEDVGAVRAGAGARIVELRRRLQELDGQRRRVAAAEIDLLEGRLRAADLEVERLTLVEQRLAEQLDAVIARERALELRQTAAEARVRINETLAGLSGTIGALAPGLAEAEERAEALEARAEAIERLIADESQPVNREAAASSGRAGRAGRRG
jgi:hypothetical protein